MDTACDLKREKTFKVLLQRKTLGLMRYWCLSVAEHCCRGEGTEAGDWHLCPPVQDLSQTEPCYVGRECPLP